jgi:hypothetical protein
MSRSAAQKRTPWGVFYEQVGRFKAPPEWFYISKAVAQDTSRAIFYEQIACSREHPVEDFFFPRGIEIPP